MTTLGAALARILPAGVTLLDAAPTLACPLCGAEDRDPFDLVGALLVGGAAFLVLRGAATLLRQRLSQRRASPAAPEDTPET